MATNLSQSGTLDRGNSLLAAAIPLARRMARPLLVPYIVVSLGTWLLFAVWALGIGQVSEGAVATGAQLNPLFIAPLVGSLLAIVVLLAMSAEFLMALSISYGDALEQGGAPSLRALSGEAFRKTPRVFGATFLKEIGAFGGYLLLAIATILITTAVAFGTTLLGSSGGGAGGPAVPVLVFLVMVPGLFAAMLVPHLYMMTTYFLAEPAIVLDGAHVGEAMKRSKELMYGARGQLIRRLLPLILAAMAILVVPFAVFAIAGAATSNSTLLFAGQGLYMLFALFTGFGFELFYAAAKVQTYRRRAPEFAGEE